MKNLKASSRGFSLIEVIVAMCIFLILSGGIYFTYANLLEIIGRTRVRTLGTSLLEKEVEIIRNLPFDQVGISGGFPAGLIAAEKTVAYEGVQFQVNAYVRNVDHAFDGTAGGSPNDTAPADYRLVQLVVSCPTCLGFSPLTFATFSAPQNLESATNNGSLFINVFDANGQPVSGANVNVVNSSTTPTITINDTTNNSGTLQLVDIPTSTTAYRITITKTGYSSSQTYTPGAAANPNPFLPHATVAQQTVTQISFAIDRTSTISAISRDYFCAPVASFDFTLSGTKLIGAGPDVLYYSGAQVTDGSGNVTITGLAWDTYSLVPTDTAYDLAGSIPLLPVNLDPNVTAPLRLVALPKASTSLLVSVANASGSPVNGVSVSLNKTGFNQTRIGGESAVTETDWSGTNAYNSQDGNVDVNTTTGTLQLVNSGGVYPTSTNSWLISNTIDFGTSTTFLSLNWSPTAQPGQAGPNSLQFQLASNNDNATWNFYGPDGTGNTFFNATGALGSAWNGNRYLRYKVYLNTINSAYTPSLQDVTIGFSSGCIPRAQTFWSNLPTGTYGATVSAAGYTTATSSITVASGWQEKNIILQ